MKKAKTTVIFLNKDSQPVRPKKVASHVVLNWRKYIVTLTIVILTLGGLVGYLIVDRKENLRAQTVLRSRIHNLHEDIEKMDTTALKLKFSNIDKELETINQYLKERGISESLNVPQGGEEDDEFLSADEISSFYEEYLSKISFDLAHVPLGYPYKGTITSTFGYRSNPFGGNNVEPHSGLDIRAPMGAPVKAMAKGVITFAGKRGGYGNCIIIKHTKGYETLYGHLSQILVSPGQKIDIGQQIGKVGSTGRSTGPHLHYEVHKNGKRINPKSFLNLN